jgi:TPR repeat protein
VRARSVSLWAALVLLVPLSGAWAQPTPPTAARSIATLKKQAASGDATAQNDLGFAYTEGRGVPQDDAQAFVWYRKAAEQGLALAQNNVAFAYRDGKGVLQDYAQAAIWFRKASEQGNSNAQYNLGVLYYTGDGVPQDFAESYFWLDIAAPGMLGNANQEWVGNYRDAAASKLTPSVLLRTQERARKWFEDHASNAATQKARDEFEAMKQELRQSQEFPRLKERAEAGGAMEQYQVGYSYEIGDQAPQDYALAAQWYQKSANQGFAAAQFSLGMLYEKNLGVPRDYEKAYFWLSLAASGYSEEREGNSLRLEVVSARDSSAEHLTSAKLLQVQEQTAAFLATHPKSY